MSANRNFRLDTVFPELEAGDALITPGFASTIEECYMGVVPALFHMVDLCRLLEILVTHNRVYVPRTATYSLANERGDSESILSELARTGAVRFYYPCSRGLLSSALMKQYPSPEELWSSSYWQKEGGQSVDAKRLLFSITGASGLPENEWDSAFKSLAQVGLTSNKPENSAYSVWGNRFGKHSLQLSPRICFNQATFAAMTPAELEDTFRDGKFRRDDSGNIVSANNAYTYLSPEKCIEQINFYWQFIDHTRRIASRCGAVLYHASMEVPYVQLKESEFNRPDGSSARDLLYGNVSIDDNFNKIYSRWVSEYRAKCFGSEIINAPALAQLVLANTGLQNDRVMYHYRDSKVFDELRTTTRNRKLHCLAEGVHKVRKKTKDFRELNTEAMAAIGALRTTGRADLAKYAKAKERFQAALTHAKDTRPAIRHIFSLPGAVNILGKTLMGKYPEALLDIAEKLSELLPFSNELHFGNATVLCQIASTLEDPIRSFQDVFGELGSFANEERPIFF